MRKRALIKNEKGFSLIEVVIALLLLGIIGVALLSGLATASKAIYIADTRTTAESLARSQMEYVKEQDYSIGGSYNVLDLLALGYPASYDIDVIATALAGALGGIQEITVEVYHHRATNPDPVITLENYKVNR